MNKAIEKSIEDDNSMHFKTDSTNISSVFTKKPQKYAKIHRRIMEAYSNAHTHAPQIKTILPPISRVLSEHIHSEISNKEVLSYFIRKNKRYTGKTTKKRRR